MFCEYSVLGVIRRLAATPMFSGSVAVLASTPANPELTGVDYQWVFPDRGIMLSHHYERGHASGYLPPNGGAGLLEGVLDGLKDVFVEDARRVHYREIIKQGHNLAAELVLRNWHNGGNGAEVDSEVPHPFWVLRELADHLARLHDGDDARELLKVMAEDRRDYLLGLCCDEGERRVCRCGASFTNSRDVRNHIMKAGTCHEHYVLRWVDESMLHWCSGGCGNDRCDRGQFNVPRRPFFNDTNRRLHEEGAWSRPKAAPRPKREPGSELRTCPYVGVTWDASRRKWEFRTNLWKTMA